MKITNNSAAPQGVHAAQGLVFIKPGSSRDLDLTEDGLKRARRLPFLSAAWGDQDGAAKPKENAPVVSERDALKSRAAALGLEFAGNISTAKLQDMVDEAEASSLDGMSDTDLKTFLGSKGVAVTDETREQLLELAKAA